MSRIMPGRIRLTFVGADGVAHVAYASHTHLTISTTNTDPRRNTP